MNRLAISYSRINRAVCRLRYRRAELRRLPPVGVFDSTSTDDDQSLCWLETARVHGRSLPALQCRVNSRVTWDVTLPPGAQIVSAIALMRSGGVTDDVECRIDVQMEGADASAHIVLNARSWRGRGWRTLSVRAPLAGPARVALSSRTSSADTSLFILWGDPAVRTHRTPADFVAAARAALRNYGVRGMLSRALANSNALYTLWVREHTPSRRELRQQGQWSSSRSLRFTIITFVRHPGPSLLRRAGTSLLRQSYPNWEWLVVAPQNVTKRRSMRGLTSDPRIKLLEVPAGSTPAAAWNAALHVATGDFGALLDVGDTLSPAALYQVARAIERAPDCDLLYSDEDRTVGRSTHADPRFKPDWSPDLLLACNYIGRMALFSVRTTRELGGFRDGNDGAEEWDLMLRLSRQTTRIRRVPQCLYHRGTKIDLPERNADETLREHCTQLGVPATVAWATNGYRVAWSVSHRPVVSVIVPNRDATAVITQCVHGLLRGTSYPHRELIIVDNESTDPAVLQLYQSLVAEGCLTVVPFDRPFNFSAACNTGARAARGDLLLFLNNDIEVIDPDWLTELVSWCQLPGVGVVGAKLLYPDRTIQHAGIVFGIGLVGHIFSRAPEGASGPFGSSEWYRNYLAVTGACQMMRRELFEQLGGYDEGFRLSFSDVVLCLEARKAGYRVVYTPYARLVHHESYTRKREDWPEDQERLVRYLEANRFEEDPFFHPDLNPNSAVPAVRPPFEPTPRQVLRDYRDRVLRAAVVAGR